MKEIKIYKSKWRAIKLILLCSIFVVLGLWGIRTGSMPTWVAWLNIGLFGLCYPIGLFHLFDKRPQIIINQTGIFDRMVGYLINIFRQKFICLVLDENFKPLQTQSKLFQQAAILNEAIGAQKVNISLGQVNINPKQLTDFILLMRDATNPEKKNLKINLTEGKHRKNSGNNKTFTIDEVFKLQKQFPRSVKTRNRRLY